MTETENKILGCLMGGAIGDALGYPVEFVHSFAEIRELYGEAGASGFEKFYPADKKALISDDTQMTLYTAEGLLYAHQHQLPEIEAITNSYLTWLGPQARMNIKGKYPSELAGIEALNQSRAPGITCLNSLRNIYQGHTPCNDSKGCGGIMRIAPVAVYGSRLGWQMEQTARLAGDVAEITHKHKMSTLSSACAAAIIQLCLASKEKIDTAAFARIVDEALLCVRNVYGDAACYEKFERLVRNSLSIKDNELADWQIIESRLGEGWVAEETLAIALFSVARHIGSFKDCVVCAVNHGGDSDSTGAVAGNIIGAILGYDAIPKELVEGVELPEVMERYALKLSSLASA